MNRNNINVINVLAKVLTIFFMASMFLYCLSLIFPIVWMINNSLKDDVQYLAFPSLEITKTFKFENYINIFDKLRYKVSSEKGWKIYSIWDMTYYSFVYSFGTSIYSVITIVITGYAIGRYKFFLTKTLYTIGILVMIIPVITDGGAGLLLKKQLGIYDNMTMLILTSGSCIFTGTEFFVVVSYFERMGKEYFEAAEIDGASEFVVLMAVALPLALPMMAVIFVIAFMSAWNNYTTFLYFLPSYANLALGLYSFSNGATLLEGCSTQEVLAGFVIVSIPIIIMYALSEGLVTKNLNIGGLKG